MILRFFIHATCHLSILFGNVSTHCCLFFNWVVCLLLNFKSSLYILDTSPFSDMCFENIFFLSAAYLFILLTVCFAENFSILMKSHSSLFSFMDYAFGIVSNKLLLFTNLSCYLHWISMRKLSLSLQKNESSHYEYCC